MLPFASCISFWGGKIQTDFSSFMFHIQATSQKTLVFTPMLIKVNYFVVLGHWYKTCALLSLCNVQKFRISGCIQHKLMTYLCFPMWFREFFFFQFMFELLLLLHAKCSHDSCGILFLSPSIFLPLRCSNFFFSWAISWIVLLKAEKSNPSEVIFPMKALILNCKLAIKIFFPEKWNLINPFCSCLFYFPENTSQLGPERSTWKEHSRT